MPSSPLAVSLRRRIRAARRRLTGAAVADGALVTLGVVGAGAGLALAAEATVWLGVELRTALFWTLAVALAVLVVATIVVPLLRGWGVLPGLDERAVVRRAGRDFPGADDRLATFLDLADGHDSGDDDRLHAAALDALGREVAEIPFERVRAFGPARETAKWALVPVALLVLGFGVWPQPMTAAAGRLLAPGVYFAPPAPFEILVTPGDAEVTRGAPFEIAARAVGRELPLSAELEIGRADERATETVRLQAEADRFAHTVEAVRADTRYRFIADGVRTPWYTVRAVDRPLVRGVRVTVIPPGYSGRSARPLPEGVGDATGLRGSAVRVQVQHGGPAPVEAWLSVEWEDGRGQRVPLRLGSQAALGQFRLRGAGTYTVHLRSEDGLENTDPARYRLGVLSDGPPQIALVEGADGGLDGGPRRLVFRVTDDFGFRGGRMVYRLTRGGATGRAQGVRLGVRTRPLDQDVTLDWRVPGARPGDVVEFYGQITDNDGAGGKTARTPLFTAPLPLAHRPPGRPGRPARLDGRGAGGAQGRRRPVARAVPPPARRPARERRPGLGGPPPDRRAAPRAERAPGAGQGAPGADAPARRADAGQPARRRRPAPPVRPDAAGPGGARHARGPGRARTAARGDGVSSTWATCSRRPTRSPRARRRCAAAWTAPWS